MPTCWSCQSPVSPNELPFCSCGRIQKPNVDQDFFSLLAVEEDLRLARNHVDEAYRNAAKQVHPDRFSQATEKEQTYANAYSNLINEAYQVLRDPGRRAEYFYQRRGIDVRDEEARTADPGLLMEMLELQEGLEQAQTPQELEDKRAVFVKERKAILASLIELAAKDPKEAEPFLHRLRYFRRLIEQADQKLEAIF